MGYIYQLQDPRTHEPRYVGYAKFTLEARLRGHLKVARRGVDQRHVIRWIRLLLAADLAPVIVALETVGENWQEREAYWITYGRSQGWRLCNMTAGGDGCPDPTDEVRERMGSGMRGKHHSSEAKAKIAAASKGRHYGLGRVMPEEEKQKHRAYKPTEATKLLIGKASTGRKYPNRKKISAEARQRLSLAFKGRKTSLFGSHHLVSDLTRSKQSASLKGKNMGNKHAAGPRTQESKDTMSRAAQTRWKRELENGYTMSKEHRDKISKSMTGNKNSTGKSHPISEETRERIQQAALAREQAKREKNPKKELTEEEKEQKAKSTHEKNE
jgi:hypothetical protein